MQVPNKNYKDAGSRRLMGWAFLVLVWMAIYSLFGGYLQTRKGFSRLEEVDRRLNDLKAENEALKEKQKVVNSEEYKIKVAREKLRLQRQDEVVVVLPDQDISIGQENLKVTEVKVWKKWVNLLLNQ